MQAFVWVWRENIQEKCLGIFPEINLSAGDKTGQRDEAIADAGAVDTLSVVKVKERGVVRAHDQSVQRDECLRLIIQR